MTANRAALLRLALAGLFAAAAAVWLATTGPGRRILLTVGQHAFTRLDLPVLPLLTASALLLVLAVLHGAPRAAWAATWCLSLAGILGCIGVWWLTAEPLGDRDTVLRVTPRHGLNAGDLWAAPTLIAAGVLAAIGVVYLVRSVPLAE